MDGLRNGYRWCLRVAAEYCGAGAGASPMCPFSSVSGPKWRQLTKQYWHRRGCDAWRQGECISSVKVCNKSCFSRCLPTFCVFFATWISKAKTNLRIKGTHMTGNMKHGVGDLWTWSMEFYQNLCSVNLTESKYTGISISSYERQYRNGLKCLLSLCLWPCGEAFSHWLPLSRLMRSSHSERFQRVHTRVCMCVRMYVCTRVRMSFSSWHCVRVCHLCLIVCMHAWHAYTNKCPYVHG